MPRNPNDKLTRPVSFRLTEADHTAYLEKVAASGLKPSAFFRECVLTNRTQVVARPVASDDKKRLLYLFNKASNNLNQLAHRANSARLSGGISDAVYSEILAEINELSQAMKAAIKNVD